MRIRILENRQALGEAAAREIAECLRTLLAAKDRIAVLFAAAPSQSETLSALATESGIDWARVTALHLDEYLGIEESSPASFRRYIRAHIVDPLGIAMFHGLRGEAADPSAECARYAALLEQLNPDVALLGIGENGHLAFIDPPWCNFEDPVPVKAVRLDSACRAQQVSDGCFETLDEVPQRALSLTIPAMLRARHVFVMAPGTRKARAARAAIEGPLTTACPASILRNHSEARIYLDRDSAALLSSPEAKLL